MPHKRKDKHAEYNRNRRRTRREAFFRDKECSICGAKTKLELHHRNPSEKETHAIWLWGNAHQAVEIAKCDVLCHICHVRQHLRMRMRTIDRYPGVRYRDDGSHRKKWEAEMSINGKRIWLGRFATQAEGIECYERTSLELRGYIPLLE